MVATKIRSFALLFYLTIVLGIPLVDGKNKRVKMVHNIMRKVRLINNSAYCSPLRSQNAIINLNNISAFL